MMVDGRIVVRWDEDEVEGEVVVEVGEMKLVEAPGNTKDDTPAAVPVGSPLKLVTPVTANPLPTQ